VARARRLFGTDGVRGVAGEFLTPELVFALGRAAVQVYPVARPQVLVVRDTRISGEMLESALCAGIAAAGGQALIAGVLPTPAVSVLVRQLGIDLGAVISASHNPYRDNGIKFFDAEGTKLSEEAEREIERLVDAGGPSASDGRVRSLGGALDDYLRALSSQYTRDLGGLRVLLDCANGATYQAAPLIFERLGAKVDAIANEPDGVNINEGCGSTHPERLVESIGRGSYDVGFAFDGDGDRVLAVDRTGRLVDGDEIIAQLALHLHERNELGGGVVVTVMSNYGFHQAMSRSGIEVATTPVGDKYVVEELRKRGWKLGGEQSGHVIDARFIPSGDGIAAALLLLQALDGRELSEVEVVEKLPQRLVNVAVANRDGLDRSSSVREAIEAEARALDGRGRVVVRPSGTEPVVRVMAEAPSESECEAVVGRLSAVVERELGHPESAERPEIAGKIDVNS
jgi:phosphoglucosamine mutase